MEPLALTFGVEFEFILAYFPKGPVPVPAGKKGGPQQAPAKRRYQSASPTPSEETSHSSSSSSSYNEDDYALEQREHHLQRSRLIPALRSAGIPVHPAKDAPKEEQDQGYDKWTVLGDASVTPDTKHERDMALTWANGTTTTLTRAQRKVLRFADVEVTSRVLPYCADSFREIETVLKTITSRFPVLVPETAGLHVHVGNQSRGFPLHTLQNLTTLAACFETQLNQIHPAHRLDNPYCYLPRWSFEPTDRDLWRMAEIIDAQESVAQLVNVWQLQRGSLLSNHQRCYNLANLLYQGPKKTVEFRQHGGSLNFGEVRAWALVAICLVSLAHEVDSAVWLDLILEKGYEEDFDLLGLLNRLGLTVLAEFFQERLFRHPRDLELKDPFIIDKSRFAGLYDTESEKEDGEEESSESGSAKSGSDKSSSDQTASDKSTSDRSASEEPWMPAIRGYPEP